MATIKPLENGSPWRTSGSQKWHGASPILNDRATIIIEYENNFKGSSADQDPVIQA